MGSRPFLASPIGHACWGGSLGLDSNWCGRMLRAPRNNVREAPMDAAETVALKPTSPVTDSIPLPEGLLVTILRDRLSPFQRAALVGLLIVYSLVFTWRLSTTLGSYPMFEPPTLADSVSQWDREWLITTVAVCLHRTAACPQTAALHQVCQLLLSSSAYL